MGFLNSEQIETVMKSLSVAITNWIVHTCPQRHIPGEIVALSADFTRVRMDRVAMAALTCFSCLYREYRNDGEALLPLAEESNLDTNWIVLEENIQAARSNYSNELSEAEWGVLKHCLRVSNTKACTKNGPSCRRYYS